VSLCEPESTAPALIFDDVSVVRGGNLVWSEGTFEVPAGGIVAVIGSNGSGKTSLLNVILGLIPPASGHVRVLGKPSATCRRTTRRRRGMRSGSAMR
jgi:zinc/manganese transport system ATP-binding protein